jgi:FixJ family two-component response regulator
VSDPPPVVFVVDDDPSVRKALGRLLRSAGLRAEAFASAQEFLAHERPDAPGCLVLDVQMPGLNGLELQRTLEEENVHLPIVFITGHGDIPMSVHAMKAGAADFLPKPFDDQNLLDAVRQAVAKDTQARRQRADFSVLQERVESLTTREREVLELVVNGMLNKQIGHKQGVTEKTIKVHRGQVMRKMQAGSLADLVRIAQMLDIQSPAPKTASPVPTHVGSTSRQAYRAKVQ